MAFANPAGNIFTKIGKKGRHTQSGMAAFASKAHPMPLPVWLGAFADMPKVLFVILHGFFQSFQIFL